MDQTSRTSTDMIDCACVIHGTGYSWEYVDKLYNMLNRVHPKRIQLHVYTEASRPVPKHMIKHELEEWPGISGPKKSWWYKLQLFNRDLFNGTLLYFDLDTVIVREVDWVTKLDPKYLWGIRDFRYLQSPQKQNLNSSMMWFNVPEFAWLWDEFKQQNIESVMRKYHGDQDYIQDKLGVNRYRLLPDWQFQSWRWQCVDGGYDFPRRRHKTPGTGAKIEPSTSVLVFHGRPKPHEVNDKVVQDLWQ